MICVFMESVEKLILSYHYLSNNISAKVSRTAGLIGAGDWRYAGKRLLEEVEEAVQAFLGQHKHLPDKSPVLADLLVERGIDQRLSEIVLETSQLSYWYLVFHLAKQNTLNAQNIVSALENGALSPAGVEEHAQRIEDNTTLEAVYSFIGKLLSSVNLPLDIFAELDIREMKQKPYLEDFIREM